MNGPIDVCSSGSYQLSGLPQGSTVSWAISPSNLGTLSGASGNSVTVNRTGTSSVTATLTANISGTCTGTKSQLIQIGPVNSAEIFTTGTSDVCRDHYYTYYATMPGGHKPGYTHQWTKPSSWTIMSQQSNWITLYVPMYNTEYGTVRASITNSCGTSGFSGITVYPSGGCPTYSFSVYPNPASDELNIEREFEDGKTSEESEDYEIKLYDESGKEVMYQKTKKDKTTFQIANLKKGYYYLHIFHTEGVIRKKIQIKR